MLKESQAQTEKLADLLATGGLGNRIPVIVADLRKRYPGIKNGEVMDYLETAYCPIVAGLTGLSSAEKQARMDRFSAGIRLEIYSEIDPRSGDERRVWRLQSQA